MGRIVEETEYWMKAAEKALKEIWNEKQLLITRYTIDATPFQKSLAIFEYKQDDYEEY